MITVRRAACLAALLACVLAACSSGPPSARDLILKAPGCHQPFTPSGGVAVQAQDEQECLTPDAEVFVATFASSGLQQSWLTAQGPGCECIRGDMWAAMVSVTGGDFSTVTAKVARALGGTVVSVP